MDITATRQDGGLGLHGRETADELTWLGFAFARIERQRAALVRQQRRVA